MREKKGTRVWQSLSHVSRYSWVNPWVPPARTGAQKLWTHTHPRLYWFLGLPKIAITVLVRTRTWDMVKPQQSPTSFTTPHTLGSIGFWDFQTLQLQSLWELEPGIWWNLSSHLPVLPHLLVVKKKKKNLLWGQLGIFMSCINCYLSYDIVCLHYSRSIILKKYLKEFIMTCPIFITCTKSLFAI